MGPERAFEERSRACRLVQLEILGEIVPFKERFERESLYIRPLLQVAPSRYEVKP